MKSTDRARLTAALREHVAAIAGELRAQMRAPGGDRVRALQLHKDEAVGDDFDVWTDLLSRRAAVLWVLKSVYVRVLEDRGLLAPGRLLDPEAQQLFEKLAPNLGETAFLRWVYKDLASPNGGLPELFSVQPAELVLPSDARSRALIAFWRHRDADSGMQWSFVEERFEGELMGDLYQELDPVVKDRFALCQTPDFVREFILDRTLTPAIETFGADKVRLLDPACGSGHFLIDGLKRLVAATAAVHKDWPRAKVLEHALGRVVGMDLNDYACALARARLVMTAAELAGVNTLAEAAKFHPHVYWADGLEQVERDEVKPSLQFGLFETVEEKPRATLTRADVRAALRKVFTEKFHAVVANPPYILEKDEARKSYHKEMRGKTRRYVSSSGKYSLSSPFTERCFQLAETNGFVGIITSNNFMKRDFGKPLVENVLANLDLSLIVDTSQAFIPFHGTPTVLLFGVNRRPSERAVRAVMGKRGETGIPPDPAKGKVWLGITEGWNQAGFSNEFVSVSDLPFEILAKHPWSLGGGGASELKECLESASTMTLSEVCTEIGPASFPGVDDVFLMSPDAMRRLGVPEAFIKPFCPGDSFRDWSYREGAWAIAPYDSSFCAVSEDGLGRARLHFWRLRTVVRSNIGFAGKTRGESGEPHWTWYRWIPSRFRIPLSITFAFVAAQNHFVLDRGGKVFNRSAPVIKLPPDATENDHLALLGLLNSSAACFWMKQMFHPKGATSANRNHPDPERFAYEFSATGLERFPIPLGCLEDARLRTFAKQIDSLASARQQLVSTVAWEASLVSAEALKSALAERWRAADKQRQSMLFLQEEIDWLVYALYGLTEQPLLAPKGGPEQISRGNRAFERVVGRRSFVRVGGASVLPEEAECETGSTELPKQYQAIVAQREERIRSNPQIAAIERYMFKRLWRDTEENIVESAFREQHDHAQLERWLTDRIEDVARARTAAFTSSRLAADIMEDTHVHAVAEVLTGSKAYSHEAMVAASVGTESIPNHPFHVYTELGMVKRQSWERTWELQRREDAGETIAEIPLPQDYSQGSRGKTTDFLRAEYWQLRGRLDVPKERFIAFTEVPGRSGAETLYGWAGWTPLQRLKALLAIDEELEDAGTPLADRTGVLDSAWRLLPDVAREDPQAAARLKAELQALVGPTGPSPESLEDWRKRFPPPKPPKKKTERARKAPKADEEDDT